MDVETFVEMVLSSLDPPIARPTADPVKWERVEMVYGVAEAFTANQRAIIAQLWQM